MLRACGCDVRLMLHAQYTPTELRASGVGADSLRPCGCSALQLASAGYSLRELKVAGYSVDELKHAGCATVPRVLCLSLL